MKNLLCPYSKHEMICIKDLVDLDPKDPCKDCSIKKESKGLRTIKDVIKEYELGGII